MSNNSLPYISTPSFVTESQTDQVVLLAHDWVCFFCFLFFVFVFLLFLLFLLLFLLFLLFLVNMSCDGVLNMSCDGQGTKAVRVRGQGTRAGYEGRVRSLHIRGM